MASEGQWGNTAHFSLTDLTSFFAVSRCTCWSAGLDWRPPVTCMAQVRKAPGLDLALLKKSVPSCQWRTVGTVVWGAIFQATNIPIRNTVSGQTKHIRLNVFSSEPWRNLSQLLQIYSCSRFIAAKPQGTQALRARRKVFCFCHLCRGDRETPTPQNSGESQFPM